MIKRSVTLLLFCALAIGFVLGPTSTTAHAATTSFNAGNIIDDAVFYNAHSMTTSQVQTFLNSKVPTCDTNGTIKLTYYYNSSTGEVHSYSFSGATKYYDTRAKYSALYDTYHHTNIAATPFVCLKNYSQKTPAMSAVSGICGYLPAYSSRTAAQIITDAANACGVNPQVLIVLLEKEQGLVTDDWPWKDAYEKATGFGCPDTAPCDPAYGGFFYQVYRAAYQFRNYRANPGNYNYVAGQNNKIYWQTNGGNFVNPTGNASDPSRQGQTGCGYSWVYIQNQATAGLYDYTPYRPNQNALSAGFGTGDSCSAYGNRNFYLYFTTWFGSTHYIIQGSIKQYYESGNVKATLGDPVENESSTANGGWKQCFQYGCIVGSYKTGYYMVKGSIGVYYWANKGPSGALGLPLGNETEISNGEWQQKYQGGSIIGQHDTGYWGVVNSIGIAYFSSHYIDSLGLPLGKEQQGGSGWEQCFEHGCIVGSGATGYYMVKGSIGSYYQENDGLTGRMGLPLGNEVSAGNSNIWYQKYQGGYVIGRSTTGYWGVRGSIGRAYEPSYIITLGAPLAMESEIGTDIWQQQFDNGYIVGSDKTGYWISSGKVRDYWLSVGGPSSTLKLPTQSVATTSSGVSHQTYQNGMILGSDATGYYSVKGSIYPTYAKLGTYTSDLGLPLASEAQQDGDIWSQQYQNGYIVGEHSQYYESSGPIRDRWLSMNSWNGKMGMVVGPIQHDAKGATWQHFVNGVLIINPASQKAWESSGSIRKVWASLGYQNGKLGYPTGPETYTNGIWSQTYDHGIIATKNGAKYKVTYTL